MKINKFHKKTRYCKYEEEMYYILNVDFTAESYEEYKRLEQFTEKYLPETIIVNKELYEELEEKNCELFSKWLSDIDTSDDEISDESPMETKYISFNDRPHYDYVKEGAQVTGWKKYGDYYGYITVKPDGTYALENWYVEKNPITRVLVRQLKQAKDIWEFVKIVKCLYEYV
jgi:hypothetical protein